LALGLLVVLFIGLAVGARRSWVAQREAETELAWREVATRTGHAYSSADVPHELEQLPLPLLARIDDEVVAPELTGPSEGGIQRLFTASVDGRPATLGVADLARAAPECSLRPVGADGPDVGVGWDPLDPGLPHIRARFEVRGADTDAVEAFLGGDLGGWLAGEEIEWSIELAGNHVLVVREELPVERLGEVADVLDAFRARLPWAVPVAAPGGGDAEADADSGGGDGGRKRKRRRRRRRGGGGKDGEGGSAPDGSAADG
jgi:hypothetical protein